MENPTLPRLDKVEPVMWRCGPCFLWIKKLKQQKLEEFAQTKRRCHQEREEFTREIGRCHQEWEEFTKKWMNSSE